MNLTDEDRAKLQRIWRKRYGPSYNPEHHPNFFDLLLLPQDDADLAEKVLSQPGKGGGE